MKGKDLRKRVKTEKIPPVAVAETEKPNQTPVKSNYTIDVLLLILMISITVAKLWYRLDTPKDIVWDETHFTKFSSWYITGHYFVDIHPPLAKLFMAALIWLSNYQILDESAVQWWTANGFVGTKDYIELYNQPAYLYVRFGSLIAGTILVAATYITMRLLGCKRFSSFFTAWMIMTDHLITLDSRLILTDVYLWMFHILTIGASVFLTRATTTSSMIWRSFATGILLGCTVSVKYTAFGTFGMIGFHHLIHFIYRVYTQCEIENGKPGRRKKSVSSIFSSEFLIALWKAVIILSCVAFVFIAVWGIHIKLLPYKGQGDGFMDQRFSDSREQYYSKKEREMALETGKCPNHAFAFTDCGYPTITKEECEGKGCCWDTTSPKNWCYYKSLEKQVVKPIGFFEALSYMLAATWSNNQGEELNYHPQMSKWYQWPLLNCKLVDFGFGIYSIGNPAVWWSVAACIPFVSLVLLEKVRFIFDVSLKKEESICYAGGMPASLTFLILLVGYLGNWLPFILIVRSTWNYHYMLALLVGILVVGLSFDFLLKKYNSRKSFISIVVVMVILMVLMTVAFWYWSPWVYGFQTTRQQKLSMRWNSLWGI